MAADNQHQVADTAKQGAATAQSVDSKISSNHVEATQNNSDNDRYNEKEGLRAYDDGLDHEHEPPVNATPRSTYRTYLTVL